MNSLFFGKKMIRLKCTDSTNNYAVRLLRQSGRYSEKKIIEGTAVTADFQKAGKGQRGNKWESEKGKNLTFSLILTPAFLKVDRQFILNKIISLGIYDFLNSIGLKNVSVKWPNDIMVGRKKIAGILIENTLRSSEITFSIVGIGININQKKFSTSPHATSIKIITGKKTPLNECFENLCSFLETRYLKSKSDPSCHDKDYLHSLYQFNEWKKYQHKGEKITAKITGLASQGLLVLKKENEEEIICDFKEVVFL